MTRSCPPLFEDFAEKTRILENQLGALYERRAVLYEEDKLTQARALIDQIGTVDLASEGLETAENQRDLSIKFHWGHDHKFSDELFVSGRMGGRHLNLMAQFLARQGLSMEHFKGKSVIDVGCWTGGTTLLLKMLGAGRVLALEEVQKYAQTTRKLVQDIYGYDDVVCEGTNLYALDAPQKFDIAYFPGVIYHLSDPVLGLRRLFNALADGGEIFVESAGLDNDEPICRFDGNRLFHGTADESAEALNRGGWNWFIPSASALERWLLEAGFEDIDCFFSPVTGRVFGYGVRKRFRPITKAGFSRPDVN